MNIELLIMMMMAGIIPAALMVGRKPKFDIPDERKPGANLHWFSLLPDTEAVLRIKQIYFDVGDAFKDAGWNIPNSTWDRLIALVVLESEIVTTNSKGEQTWAMALVTQAPVGDLYRECWKAVEAGKMGFIEDPDMICSPLSPHPEDVANKLVLDMDSFTSSGAFSPTATIRHEAHPTNPARTVYVMTDFTC